MTRHHSHHLRYHRRCERECQPVSRVLAKTLELTHEGVIMPTGSINATTALASKTPSAVAAGGAMPPPSIQPTPPKSMPSHSTSESSSEGTHRAPLRHTRVRSVRVTVEPQVCIPVIDSTNKRGRRSSAVIKKPKFHVTSFVIFDYILFLNVNLFIFTSQS